MIKMMLLIVLCVLNLLDIFMTAQIVPCCTTEGNPIAEWIINNYGFAGLTGFKIFWIAVIGLLIRHISLAILVIPVLSYSLLFTYHLWLRVIA